MLHVYSKQNRSHSKTMVQRLKRVIQGPQISWRILEVKRSCKIKWDFLSGWGIYHKALQIERKSVAGMLYPSRGLESGNTAFIGLYTLYLGTLPFLRKFEVILDLLNLPLYITSFTFSLSCGRQMKKMENNLLHLCIDVLVLCALCYCTGCFVSCFLCFITRFFCVIVCLCLCIRMCVRMPVHVCVCV